MIICFAVNSSILFAQQKESIAFTAALKNEILELDETTALSVVKKIDQIITYNNAGAKAPISQLFVIYPEFTIINDDVIETGVQKTFVIRAELSLFAMSLVDGSTFGNIVMNIEGNGRSKQACLRQMINSVRYTDPKFSKFISDAQDNVVEYYKRLVPTLLKKAQTLVAQTKYEEAMAVLAFIPETINEYDIVSKLMEEIFIKEKDRQASVLISQARANFKLNDKEAAVAFLALIDPLSTHYAEAQKLIDEYAPDYENLSEKGEKLSKNIAQNKELSTNTSAKKAEIKKSSKEESKKQAMKILDEIKAKKSTLNKELGTK